MLSDMGLIELVEPVVESLGLELWGLDMVVHGREKVLCIYIERDSEQGVGVEDCEAVSRQVSSLFDGHEYILPIETIEKANIIPRF